MRLFWAETREMYHIDTTTTTTLHSFNSFFPGHPG